MRLASTLLALLAVACTRAPQGSGSNTDVAASAWRYEVTLDDALGRMEVTMCFTGPAPRELRAGRDEAASRLLHARWLGPGAVRKLPVVAGRIQLGGAARDGCMQYAVSLAEGGSLRAVVRRVGRDLLASPSVWLWRPERRARELRATMTLRLPAGVSALLPWPEERGLRVLDARAFRFESYAAFGHFEPVAVEHVGVRIELALLDGALAIDRDAALSWLRGAVAVAAQSVGRFPRTKLAAIVVPTSSADAPCPFGMVARGGDASLLLLVGRDATARQLARDWVAPHELSHLLLPFVEREHAWLSEGFATYYQELLRARAGLQSERAALGRLVQAARAARAEAGSLSLVAESARMDQTQAYTRVYWGGAALFFKADVALRARTHGHQSLDTLAARLRAEPDADEVWDAQAMFARLDQLSGTDVFAQALHEAATAAQPDLDDTLARLGVRVEPTDGDGDVTLDDAAPLAELRRTLFAPIP